MIFQIDEIKKNFLDEENKFDKGLLNSLKDILERYKNIKKTKSSENTLDPFILRKELADLFKEDNKFQLKQMADPVEAFFSIINSFHSFSMVNNLIIKG